MTENLPDLRVSAEQGNAKAQFWLGSMHVTGEGVPQDDAEAARWWRLAAEQGNASAQFSLGNMYDFGKGVPENGVEAIRWYRLAAAQGSVAAQHQLTVKLRRAQAQHRPRRDTAQQAPGNDRDRLVYGLLLFTVLIGGLIIEYYLRLGFFVMAPAMCTVMFTVGVLGLAISKTPSGFE